MNYAIENEYYPYADETEAEDAFVIHVDECNDPVKLWDMTIDFSRALYRIDRTAYNEAFNNWLDSEMKERQMSVFKVHYLASDHIEYWYAEDEDEFLEELMARYAVSKAKHDACEHNYIKDEKLSNMSDREHVFEVCTGCGWAKML